MMRHRFIWFLSMFLVPVCLLAQTEKLDTKGVYERAIKEYISLHPEDVVVADNSRFLFLEKEAYTKNLRDTISGTQIVFLVPDSSAQILTKLLPRKRQFTLLQMHQLFARATVNHVYFYPMKASWNPKKGKLKVSGYEDRICRIDFDSKLENETLNYYFKESTCNVGQ